MVYCKIIGIKNFFSNNKSKLICASAFPLSLSSFVRVAAHSIARAMSFTSIRGETFATRKITRGLAARLLTVRQCPHST